MNLFYIYLSKINSLHPPFLLNPTLMLFCTFKNILYCPKVIFCKDFYYY